jgi:hypothetical protein
MPSVSSRRRRSKVSTSPYLRGIASMFDFANAMGPRPRSVSFALQRNWDQLGRAFYKAIERHAEDRPL